MQKGTLYLIPSAIGNSDLKTVLPSRIFEVINGIDHYIVENIKTSSGFLKRAGIKKSIRELFFYELNVNTNEKVIQNYLDPADEGKNIGLISEAGIPCVADPGAPVVSLAHQKGISVIPLVGPSSILLALMASGLNGQNFAFAGYLPIEKRKRKEKLKELEKKIKTENQTQIFIEAPHRNDKLTDELLSVCDDTLYLSVAKNLTMDNELIATKKISEWKISRISLGKNPTVFILGK
jgi:16S rRNA (cytidine1402-2'-O)-methyltransferase